MLGRGNSQISYKTSFYDEDGIQVQKAQFKDLQSKGFEILVTCKESGPQKVECDDLIIESESGRKGTKYYCDGRQEVCTNERGNALDITLVKLGAERVGDKLINHVINLEAWDEPTYGFFRRVDSAISYYAIPSQYDYTSNIKKYEKLERKDGDKKFCHVRYEVYKKICLIEIGIPLDRSYANNQDYKIRDQGTKKRMRGQEEREEYLFKASREKCSRYCSNPDGVYAETLSNLDLSRYCEHDFRHTIELTKSSFPELGDGHLQGVITPTSIRFGRNIRIAYGSEGSIDLKCWKGKQEEPDPVRLGSGGKMLESCSVGDLIYLEYVDENNNKPIGRIGKVSKSEVRIYPAVKKANDIEFNKNEEIIIKFKHNARKETDRITINSKHFDIDLEGYNPVTFGEKFVIGNDSQHFILQENQGKQKIDCHTKSLKDGDQMSPKPSEEKALSRPE